MTCGARAFAESLHHTGIAAASLHDAALALPDLRPRGLLSDAAPFWARYPGTMKWFSPFMTDHADMICTGKGPQRDQGMGACRI
ncbi:hypothetical protein [Nocardia shimofusensis]|uniref:hypothetical protein n=1 Tax=Nocardia shimofusensis TaxID=228596 RepID=UPI00083549F3|nr:hypothetical protein [Nocardia shimofusensis]